MAFSLRRSKQQDDIVVDRVTGAFNRRQLDADIAAGHDTSDLPTASLLISVDDFANYTGKKGMASGDQVLERVAWVIKATVRTTDVVYRHDRDSFCVLLPATQDARALTAADRIRANVERMPLLAESQVTVSVGVAIGAGSDLAGTIGRADVALSSGAGVGANRVFRDGDVADTAQQRRDDRAARIERPDPRRPITLEPSASTPLTPPTV